MIDPDALYWTVKDLMDGDEYGSGPAVVWPEVKRVLALDPDCPADVLDSMDRYRHEPVK